jgi:uncharacterized membrane protein YkvA (DUF1232 family)
MAFEPPDYTLALCKCVEGYEGAYQRSVLLAPQVFAFYAALFADERLPAGAQPLVNAVLAYFVAPHDAMPEAILGPYGLLDDLFVAAHTYRLLNRNLVAPEVLKDAWGIDEDLDDVMSEIYTESRTAVGKNRRLVLKMAGISGAR